MNDLKIFENPEFGQVRVVEREGEPWFVGKDVAEILEYTNPLKAIRDHVDNDDRGVTEMFTPGGKQGVVVINESGLYSLILSSKLPTAKQFKRWVTSEVLPSIRKTGGYIMGQESMSDTELLAQAVLVGQKIIEEKSRRIAQLESEAEINRPKVLFADAVSASDETILVRELAKYISSNGGNVGERRLFEWMRENGYLIRKKGSDYNTPTQRAMDLGLFKLKKSTVINPDGRVVVKSTPRITGKGQEYFLNVFLQKGC